MHTTIIIVAAIVFVSAAAFFLRSAFHLGALYDQDSEAIYQKLLKRKRRTKIILRGKGSRKPNTVLISPTEHRKGEVGAVMTLEAAALNALSSQIETNTSADSAAMVANTPAATS